MVIITQISKRCYTIRKWSWLRCKWLYIPNSPRHVKLWIPYWYDNVEFAAMHVSFMLKQYGINTYKVIRLKERDTDDTIEL